jgi:phenylalanyl-tRNA synthetase alpha chain
MMNTQIDEIRREAVAFQIDKAAALEDFRLRFLSKKGALNGLFEAFRALPSEEKRTVGPAINQLKTELEERWEAAKKTLDASSAGGEGASANNRNKEIEEEDLSLPAAPIPWGGLHPISLVRRDVVNFFATLGFTLSEGMEMVDDWHNFGALNFAADHPAREMQDTFFVQTNPDILLRTHTSSVQVKEMQLGNLPIRTLSPGRVYRNETVSARSHMQFHQIEGLYIDEQVSFGDLRLTLNLFAAHFFGSDAKIRFRPSYFPFTEPSAEMDVSCFLCKQEGCAVCKHTGWVEILGCGMVDPQVLEHCGIDSQRYSGYAFGMGIERLTMLRYQIRDIRHFFENDLQFLRQFSGE